MDAINLRISQLVAELIQHSQSGESAHEIFSPGDEGRDTGEMFELLDSAAEALTSIRDQVNVSLQNAILEIKSRRNQLTPIYHLPPEIYSRIFEFACTRRTTTRGRILQVSKLWREIVLNTPRLWTRINANSAELIAACVLRSKNAPLEIDLPDDTSECDPEDDNGVFATACTPHEQLFKTQMALLMPQIHRWQSLALENVRARHFWPKFCIAAPWLEKLALTLTPDVPVSAEDPPPETPRDIFAGVTPHLRSLRLERIYIPLTSSIYTGLEALSVQSVDLSDFTANEFLDVLRACPRLESLWLNWIIMLGPTHESQPIVELPRLSTIDINSMSSRAIRHILSSIDPPSLEWLSVRTNLEDEETIYDALPFDMIANFKRTVENIHIGRLELILDAFPGGTSSFTIAGGVGDIYPALSLRSMSPSRDSLLDGLFPHILPILGSQALTALSVDGLPASDAALLADFHQLIVQGSEIRHLEFKRCCPSFLLPLRRVSPDTDKLLCPKLSELSISSSASIDGQELIEMVRARAAILKNAQDGDASALQKLHIASRYPLDEEVVRTFKELVPDFSHTFSHTPPSGLDDSMDLSE
ncbi:hypothetical protein BOTBODRAFT_54953 [Botryobasidium botryosum FD-172 SS1]|uniref:F-box domain-containing protein n=1 Tax=Botryobasidium botryosum (strain FD-172 SS1) TaxID=930990 RepID=A0A067MK35_BOTB1|nr:hypothetical protein BOTBODRAFT_54953 [Botryobasidium botryosum FD-172 SS1]